MSTLSLIVTSFDVGPWIEQALDSAARVLRPGDELIVVDDASRDEGPARIRGFAGRGRLAEGVAFHPVLLGRNTPGGVGPAANIGLGLARGEIVAFLDGDDWLDTEGFAAVRARFETQLDEPVPADVMIANYAEWNEAGGHGQAPADARRWSGVETLPEPELRDRALSMIAVPWRKLYRRDFLTARDLRFPEGDFFFEDNPFHWAVCRAARRIAFHDRRLCHHRVHRPGQTIASSGEELLAFFDHHETILSDIPRKDRATRSLAMLWLVENLSWHMGRLRPDAIAAWVARAETALAAHPGRDWRNRILAGPVGAQEAETLDLIRQGRTDAAMHRLMLGALARQEARFGEAFGTMRAEIGDLRGQIARAAAEAPADPALLAAFERARAART
ncbi:glycosyltransferase family 2 protein [Limimaricola cinnabarinus]|uniref:glycosyltransferase family 2 protein n=1 Tax=Limimaricola cinnabarinus TaxID=1125964 RepID=UPI00248F8002|nr:glycosyltransferase family 2 protein [Limimaricola cinnabarinus]